MTVTEIVKSLRDMHDGQAHCVAEFIESLEASEQNDPGFLKACMEEIQAAAEYVMRQLPEDEAPGGCIGCPGGAGGLLPNCPVHGEVCEECTDQRESFCKHGLAIGKAQV
jgi:hypothetical protein